MDKKYEVWVLVEAHPNWYEWQGIGRFNTIEAAEKFGELSQFKFWRIRLTSESTPIYVLNGWDDGKWIK